MDWVNNQINLIKDYQSISIYIIATIQKENEISFKTQIKNLFQFLPIIIECYYENEYEYRGILKIWELGQNFNKRNDIFLYFHSKGVTHHQNYSSNKNDDYNDYSRNNDIDTDTMILILILIR